MRIYLADIKDVKPRHFNLISPERQKKAERYRLEEDKKRCVLGGLLMRKLLEDTRVYIDKNGKPLAENGRGFNLSHSGDYVIFALGDGQIGCDIEKFKYVPCEKMGRIVFCENELNKIKNSPDRLGEFFMLWTKKEALLKCMGDGFSRPAKSVDVSLDRFEENGRLYRFKTICFADYTISVCTDGGDLTDKIEFISF